MKKKFLALLLAAILCLSFAACGQSSTEEKEDEAETETAEFTPSLDTEEEVTLNIVGYMENFEALEAVITDFEEYYPNCEVIYSTLSGSNRNELLEARLRSDDSVGIFMIGNYIYDESEYVSSVCVDLQSEDIDLSAIRDEAISSCIGNGKMYGLPLALNSSGLLVNTTLLEEEGLSVPENYQEFLDVCESLKEKGYTPIQGFSSETYSKLMAGMTYVDLAKASEEGTLDTLLSGEEGTGEPLRETYEILNEIVEAGYTDPAVNDTYENNYDDAILRFFEGDVPFMAATTETYSGTKKRESKSEHYSAEPFDYQFISTPFAEDGAYCYLETWSCFGVNENCPQKDWALEFIRFLATEKEINQLASVKGLPSVAKESDDERYANLFSESDDNLRYNKDFFPGKLDEAIWQSYEAIGLGTADVDGAIGIFEELLRTGE